MAQIHRKPYKIQIENEDLRVLNKIKKMMNRLNLFNLKINNNQHKKLKKSKITYKLNSQHQKYN